MLKNLIQLIYSINRYKLINDLATSVCNDAGQFCTKPGLIFYPNNKNGLAFKDEIIDQILKKTSIKKLFELNEEQWLQAFQDGDRNKGKEKI